MQSSLKVLSQTDMAMSDKVFRLRVKIDSRITFFEEVGFSSSLCQNNPALLRKLIDVLDKYRLYLYRLDYNILSRTSDDYHDIYKVVKEWPVRGQHLFDLFGIVYSPSIPKSSDIDFFMNSLSEGSKVSGYLCMKSRLMLEMVDSLNKGWFQVFSTLTVDSENYTKVFEKGSRCWENYIRSVKCRVAAACYGSRRLAKGKDYFSYFAVVEQGGKTGRLHIHVIMFMKSCLDFTDPNLGRHPARMREIKELTCYWPFGYSTHMPVRYSAQDSYGQRGWVWPVDMDGQPMACSSVGKVSGYLLKYLLKARQVKIKGAIKSWKSKVSLKLGQRQLIASLSAMPSSELLTLVVYRKYPTAVYLYGSRSPSRLIRGLSTKEFIRRQKKLKSNLSQLVLPRDMNLKMLLRNMIPKKLDHKSVSIGDLMTEVLQNGDISNGYEDLFSSAKDRLERDFLMSSDFVAVSGGNSRNHYR